MIQRIKDIARLKGACEMRNDASDWSGMAKLLFSPQGREFCQEKNFPDIQIWSRIKSAIKTEDYGVYVDSGTIEIDNPENIALIGMTNASVHFHGVDKSHRVFLQHGAKAIVKVTDWAVVLIVKCKDCDIEIDNDGTGIVVYE